MKKKKWVILMILLLIITILICFFFLFVPWYNNTFPSFQTFDKTLLYNYKNEYEINQKNFYKDYINYSIYEDEYNTEFFYRDCSESFLPDWYALYNNCYGKTYSYIIFLEDDYENVKTNLLTTLEIADIPVGKDNPLFIKSFEVEGTIYNRIYWQEKSEEEKEFNLNYPHISTIYFFSYNDDLKYVAFSIAHWFNPIEFSSEAALKRMIKLNFDYGYER